MLKIYMAIIINNNSINNNNHNQINKNNNLNNKIKTQCKSSFADRLIITLVIRITRLIYSCKCMPINIHKNVLISL